MALQTFQFIYNGARLNRVTGASELIGRIEAIAGSVKAISVQAPNVGAVGNFVFNVRKNGTALLSGSDKLTVNTGAKRVEKTDADFDTITTVKGDLLSFAIDEVGAGGILGDIIFNVVIEDGVSPALDTEALQDLVAAMFISGSNTSLTYNDADGTLKVDAVQLTDEQVQDKVGAFISGGANTTVTYNDGANTLTIAETTAGKTTEEIEDIVAALLAQGSNITLTYNDAGNMLTIAASAGGATNLDGLSDVVITTPSTNQLLKYDGTNWVNATVSSGGAASQVDVFTSSGTWTKPSGAKFVEIFVVGGGGGGAGRKGAAGTDRTAGGSGSGAATVHYKFGAAQLGSTETVTVGASGAGGAAQTTNSTNGAGGSDGGNTSFGNWLRAFGGKGGGGGNSAGAGGGNAVNGFPMTQNNSVAGSLGFSTAGSTPTRTLIAPGSGGSGGGISSSNTTSAGAAGAYVGDSSQAGFLVTILAGGAANGGNGTDAFNSATPGAFAFIGGSGGGGGNSSTSGNATSGGNGGFPGGGAGSGGAAVNSVGNSGAGGNGGAGVCIVITYF